MATGSIYSAGDKALFDAINQSTVTAADLRTLFLRHGVIISNKTKRRDLALHFARLMHDYSDFETLAKIFEPPHRRERLSSARFSNDIVMSDFESAAHEVVATLTSDGDAANVTIKNDGSIQLHVRYKRMNFSKSEFRQIETKEAIITIENELGATVIRGPQNEKVDRIVEDIVSKLQEDKEENIDIERIELTQFPSSKDRVHFFEYLINNVKGLTCTDVTDVFLFNPIKQGASIDDTDLLDEDQGDDSDSNLGVHIESASLKGGHVLESPEIKKLFEGKGDGKGEFYISKIIWRAKTGDFDSDLYEFEAQFTEPETCTRFSYLIRGFYEYVETDTYGKSRKQFDKDRDRELGRLLESAARSALSKLTENK